MKNKHIIALLFKNFLLWHEMYTINASSALSSENSPDQDEGIFIL